MSRTIFMIIGTIIAIIAFGLMIYKVMTVLS